MKNNIRDQEKQKTKLLSDLVSFEKIMQIQEFLKTMYHTRKTSPTMDLDEIKQCEDYSLVKEFDAKKNS